MQFAVLSASVRLSDTDVAFMVEACNQQAQECADAWGLARLPVAFYASVNDLPSPECVGVVIVDDLDDPGALGYHSAVVGLPFARVLAQAAEATSVTLSHEVLETLVDPSANDWWTKGAEKVAAEVCDPVEDDTYPVGVDLGGERRWVGVSNYVLPAWRGAANAPGEDPGRFDHTGRLTAPFTMTPGGYMVIEDANGNESDVFARRVRHGGELGERNSGRKLARADGRLLRRLRG